MAVVHRLTRAEARRIAVRAQLLAQDRPEDLLETVRRLCLLQLDPISSVAPSADLVLWSRLGARYSPQHLRDAIDQRHLLELRAMLRPADDLALFRAEMAQWPGPGPLKDGQVHRRDWVAANDRCRRDVLARLEADGPLPSRELPDTCDVPWVSTGWTDDKNVTMLLELLVARGEVAVAGRTGRERLWDLAARVYPDDVVLPVEEARAARDERRLRSLGVARARAAASPVEPVDVREAGEPAVVEGVRGRWRVDPEQLGQPFVGRAALLSPFDRLLHDRRRMQELFAFEYALEMYKPVSQRRWGYYALPILYEDRLVGKLDAKSLPDDGVLRVTAVHEDVPFTAAMTAAVQHEIEELARWLDLEPSLPDR